MTLLTLVATAGIIYCAVALFAVVRFAAARPKAERHGFGGAESGQGDTGAGVTVLKPIAGLEVELYENLCSFCEQDYPKYQVIFGVQRSDDPAIAVIQRVIAQYPQSDLALVVGEREASGNPKVANLANMLPLAKYDLLFIADADMRVDRTYLANVGAEFGDERVGAATCLYVGVPQHGVASALGALHFNDQFAPSVLVATLGGPPRYCFGSTMAVRRDVLAAIGGLAALAPHLADDYMLGALVTRAGYRVALSRYVVQAIVSEPSVGALLQHELRWARTIRSVQPAGYALSFVTFPLPFALLSLGWDATSAPAWIATAAVLAVRSAMHAAARKAFGVREDPPLWLLPLRDILSFGVWAAGLFGTTVTWKNEKRSV